MVAFSYLCVPRFQSTHRAFIAQASGIQRHLSGRFSHAHRSALSHPLADDEGLDFFHQVVAGIRIYLDGDRLGQI